jgi:hypothetical protein
MFDFFLLHEAILSALAVLSNKVGEDSPLVQALVFVIDFRSKT